MQLVRPVLAATLVFAVVGCGKLKDHAPGGVPGGIPTSMPSGEVDPNTCGNYAASDAGAKLKAFLQATKDLQTTAAETVKIVKQSCVMMGQELGMPEGEISGDDTNGICAKVITAYQNNLKVGLK